MADSQIPVFITAGEAAEQSLKRYFDGTPCSKGHVAERYVKGGGCLQCAREYYATHKDHLRELVRKWNAENPEKAKEYREKYGSAYFAKKALESYYRNKEPFNANNKIRQERLKQAEGTHSAADIRDLHRLQKGRCANCKKSIRKSHNVDHIVPVAKGGRNDKSNLQLLCPPCNRRKRALDPIVWAQQHGRLL